MDDKLKEICDKYTQAYSYMFGAGGVMEGTLPDDNARQAAMATVIIQFEKAGGFSRSSQATSNNTVGERCPKCNGMIKSGVNKLGKPYKKCDGCRIWIGDFGATTPMKD